MLCVDVPEDCGGCGAPFQYSVVVGEELARMGFGALSTNVMVHSDIVAPYLSHLGNDEQKQQWLPKMVSGEAVGAIAMTEPGAGSDLQAMRTSAVKEGDDYILNGSKTFITNGQHADMVIVAAKTDPSAGAKGVSLFLVDTTLEGYGVGRNLDKIGQHAGDTSELFFADMRVPASALLGEAGKGFVYLMQELARERLVIGALGVAAARGALDLTVAYCQERVLFGQKLAQLQNTRFEMARMETEYRINKAFVDQCINEYVAGTLDAATASMAKYSATEMQCRVTDGCLQLFGGYGYTSEYPISRAFADARVQRIYGGTSEIMKEIIARSIFGRA
jgi:acyl-CoA dehydrogenase